MDPNDKLNEIRELVHNIQDWQEDTWADLLPQWAVNLATKVEELDDWLVKGGYSPTVWNTTPSEAET